MRPLSSLQAIQRLYEQRGGHSYGEGVTQLEHALQSAVLAQAADAPPSLVAAALLHDVGHLLVDEAEVVGAHADGRHEIAGARALAGLFGRPVRAPIALHVAAKRYLCAREPGYHDALSAASKASLQLQGGPFTDAEAVAFERQAYWRAAVSLRRFDDEAKRTEPSGRAFAEFLPLLRSQVTSPGGV